MDQAVYRLLNLPLDSAPAVKYLKTDNPSLTGFVREQFEELLTKVDDALLQKEVEFADAFYTKYKNQLRHFVMFNAFGLLRQKIKQLLSCPSIPVLRLAAQKHWKLSPQERHLSPSRQMLDHVLVAWMQVAHRVRVADIVAVKAFVRCQQQATVGHMVRSVFVVMCCVARISGCLRQMSALLVGGWPSLVHARRCLPALRTEWLPDGVDLPAELDFDAAERLGFRRGLGLTPTDGGGSPTAPEAAPEPAASAHGFEDLLWADTELQAVRGAEARPGGDRRRRKATAEEEEEEEGEEESFVTADSLFEVTMKRKKRRRVEEEEGRDSLAAENVCEVARKGKKKKKIGEERRKEEESKDDPPLAAENLFVLSMKKKKKRRRVEEEEDSKAGIPSTVEQANPAVESPSLKVAGRKKKKKRRIAEEAVVNGAREVEAQDAAGDWQPLPGAGKRTEEQTALDAAGVPRGAGKKRKKKKRRRRKVLSDL